MKILKVFAYFLTFTVLLVCGVVTKGTTLFMASQIKQGRTIEFCNQYGDKRSGTDYDFKRNQDYEAKISTTERVAWPWCIFFAFLVPELSKNYLINIILKNNPEQNLFYPRYLVPVWSHMRLQDLASLLSR